MCFSFICFQNDLNLCYSEFSNNLCRIRVTCWCHFKVKPTETLVSCDSFLWWCSSIYRCGQDKSLSVQRWIKSPESKKITTVLVSATNHESTNSMLLLWLWAAIVCLLCYIILHLHQPLSCKHMKKWCKKCEPINDLGKCRKNPILLEPLK